MGDIGQGHATRFMATPESMERDAKAFALRARHYSYVRIAQELGYASRGAAHDGVQRAIAAANQDSLQESKQLVLGHLEQLAAAAWRVLEANHIVVQNGQVVRLSGAEGGEGETITDDEPVLQAIDRLVKIEQERIRVLGLYAPKTVQVLTHDSVSQAIADLEREIAARARAAGESGRGPAAEAVLPPGAAG